MIRKTVLACAAALALFVASLVPPAGAQTFFCSIPDDEPPIIHNFDVRPNGVPRGDNPFEILESFFAADLTRVGTRISADVWDTPNLDLNNQHNGITHARLEIPEAGIEQEMEPLPDGRWGKVRQPVQSILPPATLSPGGIYTVRITGHDACANVATREWTIRQVTFLGTIQCDNAPRDAC